MFVFQYNVSYPVLPVIESDNEKGKEHEELFFDPQLVVSQVAQLLHYVFQVFFVVAEVVAELVEMEEMVASA